MNNAAREHMLNIKMLWQPVAVGRQEAANSSALKELAATIAVIPVTAMAGRIMKSVAAFARRAAPVWGYCPVVPVGNGKLMPSAATHVRPGRSATVTIPVDRVETTKWLSTVPNDFWDFLRQPYPVHLEAIALKLSVVTLTMPDLF